MAKTSAVDSLRESIRVLEIRQEQEGKELKEQFRATYESLKPANLIKHTISDLANSVEVKNNLFESVISILTGYLTKKMMVGSKSNPLMKILGALLQFGVTSLVAKNAETIRNYISDLIGKCFHSEEEEEEIRETE